MNTPFWYDISMRCLVTYFSFMGFLKTWEYTQNQSGVKGFLKSLRASKCWNWQVGEYSVVLSISCCSCNKPHYFPLYSCSCLPVSSVTVCANLPEVPKLSRASDYSMDVVLFWWYFNNEILGNISKGHMPNSSHGLCCGAFLFSSQPIVCEGWKPLLVLTDNISKLLCVLCYRSMSWSAVAEWQILLSPIGKRIREMLRGHGGMVWVDMMVGAYSDPGKLLSISMWSSAPSVLPLYSLYLFVSLPYCWWNWFSNICSDSNLV